MIAGCQSIPCNWLPQGWAVEEAGGTPALPLCVSPRRNAESAKKEVFRRKSLTEVPDHFSRHFRKRMIRSGMQAPTARHDKPDELPLFVWATRVVRRGDGRAELVAVAPKKELTVREAAEVLGTTKKVILRLREAGLIDGWKPGAIAKRRDGRESNAALVLDAESVMRYKARNQHGMLV
jgi:excisionase family DNA binding protein